MFTFFDSTVYIYNINNLETRTTTWLSIITSRFLADSRPTCTCQVCDAGRLNIHIHDVHTCTCTYRAEESPRDRMANYFSLVLIILLYRHYSPGKLTRCTNRRIPCNAVWATRCILYVQCTDMWPWHDCLCWPILASSSSVFDFSSGCFKHSTSGITAKLLACSTPFGCTTTHMSTNIIHVNYFLFRLLPNNPGGRNKDEAIVSIIHWK